MATDAASFHSCRQGRAAYIDVALFGTYLRERATESDKYLAVVTEDTATSCTGRSNRGGNPTCGWRGAAGRLDHRPRAQLGTRKARLSSYGPTPAARFVAAGFITEP